jgi:ribonuclease BN (tRNA processing enzyme)
MSLELTFLGTGNAFAPTRYWSSFLVNDRYLFDAPPTLLPHLKKLGKDPGDIEVIFISHFHGDHFMGLPFLLLEYAELAPRKKDLTIIGPPGIAKRVESATNMAFANVFRKQSRGYDLTFVEVKDEKGGTAAGAEWIARKVPHVPDLESFGYRVKMDGKTLAYSGDSSLCDALVSLADGADVFVSECSCWNETCGPIHLTPNNILLLRTKISQHTKFILTHIGAGEAPPAIANTGILIADDLKTIVV